MLLTNSTRIAMYRIALCDDDINGLEHTYSMLLDFSQKNRNTDFHIRRFQSSYDLLKCLDASRGFQIYLLDIIMPFIDGIELAKKIRENDTRAIIIFLTASPEFALKSYEVYAFQYLVKPVTQENLNNVMHKALLKIDYETAQGLAIKTKAGIKAVRNHTIVFAEYSRHSVQFHLSDNSVVTTVILRDPFDAIANKLLGDSRFIRPHMSFVANMNFIRGITDRDLVMSDGSLVSISKCNYSEVKKKYISFLLKGETDLKC